MNLHRKCNDVITSCRDVQQIEKCAEYLRLAKPRLSKVQRCAVLGYYRLHCYYLGIKDPIDWTKHEHATRQL